MAKVLIPWNPLKGVVCTCSPRAGEAETRRAPRAHWQASLVYLESSTAMIDTISIHKMYRLEEQLLKLSFGLYMHALMSICMCACTQKHTHVHTCASTHEQTHIYTCTQPHK